MKYIVTETNGGVEEIFLFPRSVHHDCMAEVLTFIKNQNGVNCKRVYRKPVSAGFVSETMRCYGTSETLELESRKQDTELLRSQLT